MKNLKLKNRSRFIFFLCLSGLIATLYLGTIISAGEKQFVPKEKYVRAGDTLWSIASEENIKMDIRDYIYEIKQLNDLIDNTIYPGMTLKLP